MRCGPFPPRAASPPARGEPRARERDTLRPRPFPQPGSQGTDRASREGVRFVHVLVPDEPGRERVGGRAEERRRVALFPHPALVQDDERVRDREGQRRVVGHDHHGDPVLLPKLVKDEPELVARDHVERLPRLVPHDHSRVGGKRPGDRHALLLAPAQAGRIPVRERAETKAVEQLLGPPPRFRPVPELHRVTNIAGDRPMGQQPEALRDVPERAILGGPAGDVDPIAEDPASPRPQEPGEGPQEGGLSGSRGAEHGDGAPRNEVEVDRSQVEVVEVGLESLDDPMAHGASSPRRQGSQPDRSPSRTTRNSANAMIRNNEATAAASARLPFWNRL